MLSKNPEIVHRVKIKLGLFLQNYTNLVISNEFFMVIPQGLLILQYKNQICSANFLLILFTFNFKPINKALLDTWN